MAGCPSYTFLVGCLLSVSGELAGTRIAWAEPTLPSSSWWPLRAGSKVKGRVGPRYAPLDGPVPDAADALWRIGGAT